MSIRGTGITGSIFSLTRIIANNHWIQRRLPSLYLKAIFFDQRQLQQSQGHYSALPQLKGQWPSSSSESETLPLVGHLCMTLHCWNVSTLLQSSLMPRTEWRQREEAPSQWRSTIHRNPAMSHNKHPTDHLHPWPTPASYAPLKPWLFPSDKANSSHCLRPAKESSPLLSPTN